MSNEIQQIVDMLCMQIGGAIMGQAKPLLTLGAGGLLNTARRCDHDFGA